MTPSEVKVEDKSNPGVVLKLALYQLGVTLVFSLLLYYCFDTRESLSALFGGVIAALANFFFAGRLFVSRKGLDAHQILRRFYRSVSMKMSFTLALFAICIIVLRVSILPFVVAYLLAAVVVNWLFLLNTEA